MFKWFFLPVALLCLSASCNGPTQKVDSKSDPLPNGLPSPSIQKLEVTQTHVIPPEGKSWTGSKLAPYNLHLVGNRQALVLVDFNLSAGTVEKPILEAFVNNQKLGEVGLNAPDTLPKTEANGPTYTDTAFWAKLEQAWIKPGLTLSVKGSNTDSSKRQAIKVGSPAEFTILTLPFYLFGLNESAIPLSQTATADQTTTDEYFAQNAVSVYVGPFASVLGSVSGAFNATSPSF